MKNEDTHADYVCLRCGETLVARRCKIQCPRCGYTEDCADAGLIDYDRHTAAINRRPPAEEKAPPPTSPPTSRRYTSSND